MAKTISFAAVHFTVAFTVGYALAGSFIISGAIAMIEPACKTAVYYFHEKMWQEVEQGGTIEFFWGH